MVLKIRHEPVWTGFGHDWLPQALAKALKSHAKDSDERMEGTLTLTVRKADSSDTRAILKVTLDGVVNGRPVQKTCSAMRQATGAHATTHMFGLVGAMVFQFVAALFSKSERAAVRADNRFTQCFAECVASLQEALDRAVGKESSALSRRWATGHQIGRLAVLITFAVTMYVNRNARFRLGVVGGVLVPALGSAALIGGSIYILVFAANLITMPDRFFLADPVGRKALARSGVSKPSHARIVAGLLSVIPALVIVLTIWMWMATRR
jgi:hypothetical protein